MIREERAIEVCGSDGETKYLVFFSQTDKGLGVSCTCPAGLFGKLCKHKLEILAGNFGMSSVDAAQDSISTISAWIKQSDIGVLVENIAIAESELDRAKSALSAAKKKLERALYERSNKA